MEKSIRFGDLVRNAGRPQTLALWTAPRQNSALGQAIRQNRVVTLVQEPTGKRKDFGLIGFHEGPHSTYLLFPRPLPHREGRIIGLNYDLIEEPRASNPAKVEKQKVMTKPTKPPPAKLQPAKPKPVLKEFTFCIRRTTTLETTVTVTAPDLEAAKRQALSAVKHQPFDLTKAVKHEEILSTT